MGEPGGRRMVRAIVPRRFVVCDLGILAGNLHYQACRAGVQLLRCCSCRAQTFAATAWAAVVCVLSLRTLLSIAVRHSFTSAFGTWYYCHAPGIHYHTVVG